MTSVALHMFHLMQRSVVLEISRNLVVQQKLLDCRNNNRSIQNQWYTYCWYYCCYNQRWKSLWYRWCCRVCNIQSTRRNSTSQVYWICKPPLLVYSEFSSGTLFSFAGGDERNAFAWEGSGGIKLLPRKPETYELSELAAFTLEDYQLCSPYINLGDTSFYSGHTQLGCTQLKCFIREESHEKHTEVYSLGLCFDQPEIDYGLIVDRNAVACVTINGGIVTTNTTAATGCTKVAVGTVLQIAPGVTYEVPPQLSVPTDRQNYGDILKDLTGARIDYGHILEGTGINCPFGSLGTIGNNAEHRFLRNTVGTNALGGLITITGASEIFFTPPYIVEGGFVIQGAAKTTFSLLHPSEGGTIAAFSGAAETVRWSPDEEQLLFTTKGAATTLFSLLHPGSGLIRVTPGVDQARAARPPAGGFIDISGGAVEAFIANPPEEQVLFRFTGVIGESFTPASHIGEGVLFNFNGSSRTTHVCRTTRSQHQNLWCSGYCTCSKSHWFWFTICTIWSSRILYCKSRRETTTILIHWNSYRVLYSSTRNWIWTCKTFWHNFTRNSHICRATIRNNLCSWRCKRSLYSTTYWFWFTVCTQWCCRSSWIQSARRSTTIQVYWRTYRSVYRESSRRGNRDQTFWRYNSPDSHLCRATIRYNLCIWRCRNSKIQTIYWFGFSQKTIWFCRIYHIQPRREANALLLHGWNYKREAYRVLCWCGYTNQTSQRFTQRLPNLRLPTKLEWFWNSQSIWRSRYSLLSSILWFWYIQEVLWCSRISHCQSRREANALLLHRRICRKNNSISCWRGQSIRIQWWSRKSCICTYSTRRSQNQWRSRYSLCT